MLPLRQDFDIWNDVALTSLAFGSMWRRWEKELHINAGGGLLSIAPALLSGPAYDVYHCSLAFPHGLGLPFLHHGCIFTGFRDRLSSVILCSNRTNRRPGSKVSWPICTYYLPSPQRTFHFTRPWPLASSGIVCFSTESSDVPDDVRTDSTALELPCKTTLELSISPQPMDCHWINWAWTLEATGHISITGHPPTAEHLATMEHPATMEHSATLGLHISNPRKHTLHWALGLKNKSAPVMTATQPIRRPPDLAREYGSTPRGGKQIIWFLHLRYPWIKHQLPCRTARSHYLDTVSPARENILITLGPPTNPSSTWQGNKQPSLSTSEIDINPSETNNRMLDDPGL